MQSWTTCLAYKKTVLSLSAVTDEDGHPLENQDESGRSLCEYWGPFFKHVSKSRDITKLRISYDLSEKLLTTSAGPLTRPSLTNSLQRRKIRLLALTEFQMVPTGVNIIVSQSKSIEDREIGKQFAPLWRELADQLKVLFPDGDDEGAFVVPALDTRSQVLSIQDRRNGVGKPVFKLASLGSGQTFTLVTPELSIPGVSPEVLQRALSQANKVNV